MVKNAARLIHWLGWEMRSMLQSYSQAAEDLLAALYLGKAENVHYIDVGCWHPVKASNTYFFYERGGEGLCIDANPDIAAKFIKRRPRDTFVSCGVSNAPGELTYYRFAKPVFNTFSETRRDSVVRSRKAIAPITVPVKPLTQILREAKWRERYGNAADFLSIDVEGFEYEVITSLNLTYVRPKLIAMEMCVRSTGAKFGAACSYLTQAGYEVCGRTNHDLFFLAEGVNGQPSKRRRRMLRRAERRHQNGHAPTAEPTLNHLRLSDSLQCH